MQLNTPADIAEWIAERKSRYPTQARVAEKRAAAEAERQRRKEEKEQWQQKQEEQRKRKKDEKRQAKFAAKAEKKTKLGLTSNRPKAEESSDAISKLETKDEPAPSPLGAADHVVKAEKVPEDPIARISFLEKQLKLAKEAAAQRTKAEPIPQFKQQDDALDQMTTGAASETFAPVKVEHIDNDVTQDNLHVSLPNAGDDVVSEQDAITIKAPKVNLGLAYSTDGSGSEAMDESDSELSSAEPSSDSSGSNDTDSDAPPEEQSTKAQGPMRVPPPKREGVHNARKPCRNIVKFGECKFGDKCIFSHDVAQKRSPANPEKRMNLRETLIEQELRQEAALGVQVIKYLGGTGFLN